MKEWKKRVIDRISREVMLIGSEYKTTEIVNLQEAIRIIEGKEAAGK